MFSLETFYRSHLFFFINFMIFFSFTYTTLYNPFFFLFYKPNIFLSLLLILHNHYYTYI
ncbi:uncharacterized protein EV154DRAFT_156986 [Mucor mucedo]|uniref:uncharacterized protein n=1 Tax=Mucor mucedo TaxID=29922 RepID=UPI00222031C3|nr:uncharacterized protein EV154DRAFT_156986 [Mucor mucedo]KAI7893305.1 hypothetical protein EV154DRAFT_156986 [Mucor mucedo]